MRHTGTLRHISARCWSAIALGALSACGGGDGGIDQQAEKALCFDSRVFAVGAKLNIDYVESGFATGARTETSVVLSDIATFNGSPNLVERRITTSGTSVRGETNYRVESNLSKYEKPLGPGVTGLYGTVANGRFGQQRTVLYNPPYEDRRGELKRGQEGDSPLKVSTPQLEPFQQVPHRLPGRSESNLLGLTHSPYLRVNMPPVVTIFAQMTAPSRVNGSTEA